jgi:hypothetical protein
MDDEAGETGAAASLLALHTMATWLVKQEMARAPEARGDLMRHTEVALAVVVRRDPGLLRAAQGACASIAQAIGDEAATARLQ